jgi:hypothetical protein
MTLDTRAIAVQGIGYGTRFIAVQGFSPKSEQAELPTILPFAPGGMVKPKPKVRKRSHEDDEFLVLLM